MTILSSGKGGSKFKSVYRKEKKETAEAFLNHYFLWSLYKY
jgi:hypothetical protein